MKNGILLHINVMKTYVLKIVIFSKPKVKGFWFGVWIKYIVELMIIINKVMIGNFKKGFRVNHLTKL